MLCNIHKACSRDCLSFQAWHVCQAAPCLSCCTNLIAVQNAMSSFHRSSNRPRLSSPIFGLVLRIILAQKDSSSCCQKFRKCTGLSHSCYATPTSGHKRPRVPCHTVQNLLMHCTSSNAIQPASLDASQVLVQCLRIVCS